MADEGIGPTGHVKNCNAWAAYEEKDSPDSTKTLCHGGRYNGDWWQPCPSKADCKAATEAARMVDAGRPVTHLPVVQGQSPFARSVTPMSTTRIPTAMSSFRPTVASAVPQPQYAHPGMPVPVQPPETYPASMRSTYAAGGMHGPSPVFIPRAGEGVMARLGKNMVQGAFGALGFHIMGMAQSVDFFHEDP